MEDEIERLRAMLDSKVGWGKVAATYPAVVTGPASAAHDYFASDSNDDDEDILSFEHRVGGRLEHAVGHGEVHENFDFPQYNLQFAEGAPEGEVFCSLRALQKYPYNYISAANREEVSKRFFDNGSFFERPWDFFYIHAPYSPLTRSRQSIVLIPSRQFQHFLASINSVLKTRLKLPDQTTDPVLLFEFPKDGTPRPRYLGHANEREMAESLKKAIPSSSYRPDDEVIEQCKPTERSLEAFKRKIELLLESDKKKRGMAKERKKSERYAKQQAWNHEIKRVQRYLGLREARYGNHGARRDSNRHVKASRPGEEDLAEQMTPGKTNIAGVVNMENPPPYLREGSVVFICVDVESYERDHNLITEIGVATLDTADISALSPGEGGINWANVCRARHFRISEYKHLRNKDFINGCGEYFQFGESEWISIKNAPQEVSKCFKAPFSKQTADRKPDQSDVSDDKTLETKRNIVLVGHDIMTDVNYLKKLGYDPHNLSNLLELIDTSSMYRSFTREPNPRNLGSILANIDIPGWYLHNAGNDAMYTLRAMISIAIRALLERPDEESREQANEVRIAESVQNAAEAAREAQQGWSSEGSDGGSPLAPWGHPQFEGSERVRNPDI